MWGPAARSTVPRRVAEPGGGSLASAREHWKLPLTSWGFVFQFSNFFSSLLVFVVARAPGMGELANSAQTSPSTAA